MPKNIIQWIRLAAGIALIITLVVVLGFAPAPRQIRHNVANDIEVTAKFYSEAPAIHEYARELEAQLKRR